MAKRLSIPSKYVQLKVIGPRDAGVVSRGQRVSATADIATNTIDELGNSQHAGTSKDVPNITLTFQVMDVGIKAISLLTGTNAAAYPGGGVDITSSIKEIDAVIMIRDENISDYVKNVHLRRCAVQSFAFNYSVDGDSTEEWTAIGSVKRQFTRDIVVEKFILGTTSFILSETPVVLKNGDYALSVVLDGIYQTEVAGAPAASGEYRIVGTTLTTYDTRSSQLLVVYQANPAGTNWSDVNELDMPAAIRGKDVDILIGANDILRVQSVTVNGAYNPTAVREMGNREIVGYTTQVPEVTGTITVLDTDTELIRLLTGGDVADTEFKTGQCSASGISLEIKLQNPADCEEPFAVLKTVYLSSISITSDGFTSNVNDNASQTFDYRSDDGSVVVYSGAK